MPDFILHILRLALAALHHFLDFVFLDAPFPAVELVEKRIPYALQDPHFVGAISRSEATLYEAAERCNAHTGAYEQHGSIGDKFAGEWVGHETAEHGNSDVEVRRLEAIVLSLLDLFSDALEETGADACAWPATPVRRFMDGDGDFDEPMAVGAVAAAGELGVLGEGVEARHQCVESGEEVGEGGLRGGKGVEELGDGDVRAYAEVTESGLALGGGEVEENLLFVGYCGVFGEEVKEGFCGWVALDVGAPGEELAPCGN